MNGVLWMMGRCLPTEQVKGSIAICLFLLQLGRRCGRGVSAPKRNEGGEWQPHEWQPHERRVQSWSNSITVYMCSNHIWRTNTFNLLLDFFFFKLCWLDQLCSKAWPLRIIECQKISNTFDIHYYTSSSMASAAWGKCISSQEYVRLGRLG